MNPSGMLSAHATSSPLTETRAYFSLLLFPKQLLCHFSLTSMKKFEQESILSSASCCGTVYYNTRLVHNPAEKKNRCVRGLGKQLRRDYNKATSVLFRSGVTVQGESDTRFSTHVPDYVSFCSIQALTFLVTNACGLQETQPPISTEPMFCLSLAHFLSKCFVSVKEKLVL